MRHRLINGDCIEVLDHSNLKADCLVADVPDNIGLKYGTYKDRLPVNDYINWLAACTESFMGAAPIVWMSFNAKWTVKLGTVFDRLLETYTEWEFKPFVWTFTFGQNCKTDCGNGHRPIWRLKHKDAPLYPDQIKVESWRQLNGDKRAAAGGRVPLDVLEFPRVTGNSKERRPHHPTQHPEALLERCIKLSTADRGSVLDVFSGTGSTLRVCKRINRSCTSIELDKLYCEKIADEHSMVTLSNLEWICEEDSAAVA